MRNVMTIIFTQKIDRLLLVSKIVILVVDLN